MSGGAVMPHHLPDMCQLLNASNMPFKKCVTLCELAVVDSDGAQLPGTSQQSWPAQVPLPPASGNEGMNRGDGF